MSIYQSIKELCEIGAISGREAKLSEEIKKKIAPFADESFSDTMGNLIALKRGHGNGEKRIMLSAHLDEVGFMVSYIEDSGLVRVCTMGGVSLSAALYKKAVSSRGVAGIILPQGKAKLDDITQDKIFIDIGAESKKEAEKRVKIGDAFTLYPEVFKLGGKRIAGRPLDNRVGCAVLIETAKILAQNEYDGDIYYAFCAQEEVGCRGSVTAAERIAPTDALCIDVTKTGDLPSDDRMDCRLGGGVAIKIKDASVICHGQTVELLTSLAKEKKIKYQNEILAKGGTDTSSIQLGGGGCAAGALSVPARNIHTGVECCDLGDIEGCVLLAAAYAQAKAK